MQPDWGHEVTTDEIQQLHAALVEELGPGVPLGAAGSGEDLKFVGVEIDDGVPLELRVFLHRGARFAFQALIDVPLAEGRTPERVAVQVRQALEAVLRSKGLPVVNPAQTLTWL